MVDEDAIVGDQSDAIVLVVLVKEDSVSAFRKMELFAHRWNPEVLQVRIMLQIFILCNCLFGNGMDNTKAVFFNVDDGSHPLRAGRNLAGLKANDVVNGLDGYNDGQASGDDAC